MRGALLEAHIRDLEEKIATLSGTNNKMFPLLMEQVGNGVVVEGGGVSQDY